MDIGNIFQKIKYSIVSHKVRYIIVALVIVILIVTIWLINFLKNSTLNIYVAPMSANIIINGKTYSNGSYDMYPGKYTATISAEGFQSKEISFTLTPRRYTNLFTYLVGENNDFSFYLQDGSGDDYAIFEQVAAEDDAAAQNFISEVKQIQSIKKSLPLSGWEYDNPESNHATSAFRIVDGASNEQCNKIACLQVTYYYGVPRESSVIEKVSQAGYNFDDYQIIYEEAK